MQDVIIFGGKYLRPLVRSSGCDDDWLFSVYLLEAHESMGLVIFKPMRLIVPT